MTKEVIVTASIISASEAIAQLVEFIVETIDSANDVLIEKKSFNQLQVFLNRVVPVLTELNRKNLHTSQSLNNATFILARELKLARQLIDECTKRNRVYLLVNCRRIVKRLEDTTKEISRALGLFPLASLDISLRIKDEMNNVCQDMMAAEFRAAMAEEEICDKIESGIQERNVDRSYANNLLVSIADALGIPTEKTSLKKEFEEFKNEINDTQLRKDQAEAIQMDQIIALLGRADATSSPQEKEMKYFNKRNSLGSQPLEPLQSFYCPITRDVMVDPVETSSGQTFERSAIDKWLSDGNKRCPLTGTSLNPAVLRPNKTLRQSIEEWKDRNTIITIASMKPTLKSIDEQEVLQCLQQLQDLCKEKDIHREWITLENYIPLFIELLSGKSREIREEALVILCVLAKDNEDTKERIVDVENAIELIVRSLARRVGESKSAVALLLELSENAAICERIGKVQGCILLLVTMSGSDDTQAARDARDILENLTFLDQNVIQMAKANYFKPLLRRLSTGPEDVKLIMAATLAEMELSDHNKAVLVEEGVVGPLLRLVLHMDPEMKRVAVKALQNLSSIPQNGLQMIKDGAVVPLLDLLYEHTLSARSLREEAAATIMNLAVAATVHETGQPDVVFLGVDDDIFRLFSLITRTGPSVQKSILRTFIAMCQSPSAGEIRSKLRQYSALQVLIPLCELEDISLRQSAVKLLYCLTVDAENDILSEHVNQKYIKTLLKIIDSSNDEEEVAAAMGIVSNLPMDHSEMTEWLLEAGALSIIYRFLIGGNYNSLHKTQLIESAVGSICRFSVSTNVEWQKKVAEMGVIPVLVQLLGVGTQLTKQRAAISLTQFSNSSSELSRPIKRHRGFLCFSGPSDIFCPVHRGICTVESSFCLVEAEAVEPLVTILGEPDIGACGASLEALLTLIDGEKLQSGSKVLSEANAIVPMIKLLSSQSVSLQEKSLHALERIFRLVEFKQKYATSIQMPLVDITQRGTSTMKSLAARMLGYLNVLPEQSTNF